MSVRYKESERPKKGGWAPGSYMGNCITCEQDYIGDKRSHTCADCAYKNDEVDTMGIDEEKYTDREWLMVQRHAKLIAKLKAELEESNDNWEELKEHIQAKPVRSADIDTWLKMKTIENRV